MLYSKYPQPWRGWLWALFAVIWALIIIQFAVGSSWVLYGVVLALIAIHIGLNLYARRQM